MQADTRISCYQLTWLSHAYSLSSTTGCCKAQLKAATDDVCNNNIKQKVFRKCQTANKMLYYTYTT